MGDLFSLTMQGTVNSSVAVSCSSVVSNRYVRGVTGYSLGGVRQMSPVTLGGGDSDRVTGLNWDTWLVGHCKILAWQWAKLPRYGGEGAVEVRPFPAEKRPCVS